MPSLKEKVFQHFGREYIENQTQQINMLMKKCDDLSAALEEEKKALYGAQVSLSQVYQYMQERKEMNPLIEQNLRGNNDRIEILEHHTNGFIERADMLEVKVKANSKNISIQPAHSENIEIVNSTMTENEYSCIDYFDFENHFRGSREQIKEVQRQYIPYFDGKDNVLDLGCGRGEFLELLKECHINAIGVECYTEFAEYCKMKSLNVVEEDALSYLEKQEKVGGIFAGQLIEHLKTNQVMRLCELAYEKLEKGAYVILETPNPMSLAIYTHAFYMDPSHNKPVHPLLMEYFMKKAGFTDVQIVFTESSKYPVDIPTLKGENIENIEAFNESMKIVSNTLFGSQDYAIVARK